MPEASMMCVGCWLDAGDLLSSQWEKRLVIWLMVEILHYIRDRKLWELWYIPYYG